MRTHPTLNMSMATIAAATALLLGGCTVGPDFRTPEPTTDARYTASAQPAQMSAAGYPTQTLATADIPRQWWALFRNPQLDETIRVALANSPTLAQAQARLRHSGKRFGGCRNTSGIVTERLWLHRAFGDRWAVDWDTSLVSDLGWETGLRSALPHTHTENVHPGTGTGTRGPRPEVPSRHLLLAPVAYCSACPRHGA